MLPPLGLPLVPPICSPSPGPLPRLPVVYFVKIIIKSLLVLVSFFAIVFNSVCAQLYCNVILVGFGSKLGSKLDGNIG